MPPYARAYLRIRDSGVLDSTSRAKIEKDLAFSLDHIFHFPEWGAHNRAMLRAESLYYGSVALPQHPSAAKWRRMAETLASDSLGHWEIEDASGYQAIWLYALFSYAEISGRPEIYQSIQVRYYLDYFVQLLTPHGNIADFGDSHWNGNWERFVAIFEKAASVYQNPQYKYVAQELTRRALGRMRNEGNERGGEPSVAVGSGVGSAFTDAFRWADDAIHAQPPASLSQEVLEDVVGKKVAFRDGWDPTSTFLLLNYRDEGDGGILALSASTISVEEEKMTTVTRRKQHRVVESGVRCCCTMRLPARSAERPVESGALIISTTAIEETSVRRSGIFEFIRNLRLPPRPDEDRFSEFQGGGVQLDAGGR
jgi:hypothetical protein